MEFLMNASEFTRAYNKNPGTFNRLFSLENISKNQLFLINPTDQLQGTRVPFQSLLLFNNLNDMGTYLKNNPTPSDIHGIVYSPDALTPPEEQADLVNSTKKAAAMAHENDVFLIANPNPDIMKNVAQEQGITNLQAFINSGYATRLAAEALDPNRGDSILFQTQHIEKNPQKFSSELETLTSQARQGNQNLKVIAGLSTNPEGQQVTSAELQQAVSEAQAIPGVAGFWFNDPQQCAKSLCTGPYPEVVDQTLDALLPSRAHSPALNTGEITGIAAGAVILAGTAFALAYNRTRSAWTRSNQRDVEMGNRATFRAPFRVTINPTAPSYPSAGFGTEISNVSGPTVHGSSQGASQGSKRPYSQSPTRG